MSSNRCVLILTAVSAKAGSSSVIGGLTVSGWATLFSRNLAEKVIFLTMLKSVL